MGPRQGHRTLRDSLVNILLPLVQRHLSDLLHCIDGYAAVPVLTQRPWAELPCKVGTILPRDGDRRVAGAILCVAVLARNKRVVCRPDVDRKKIVE